MDELNEQKLALIKSWRIFLIVTIITVILGFITFFIPLIIVGFVFFILTLIKTSKIKELDFKFKSMIMDGLARKIFDEAKYIPNGFVSKEEYRESEFSSTGDSYSCIDSIDGKLNGTKFDVSDITITETHNNGKNSYTVTLFDGLFARIDTGKDEVGKVKISERNSKSFFDGYKKVEFESVEFNKKFNAIATDEHLAFYLTNPKMMEILLDLERRYQGDFYLLYKDGLLYVLINGIRFDFNVKTTELYTEELINEYKQSLMNIKSIVEAL